MRLINEILRAIGADGLDFSRVQYTVVDGKGGYFQNVRRIVEFSPEKIVLAGRRGSVCIEGSALSLGKCALGDVSVFGDIQRVGRFDAHR